MRALLVDRDSCTRETDVVDPITATIRLAGVVRVGREPRVVFGGFRRWDGTADAAPDGVATFEEVGRPATPGGIGRVAFASALGGRLEVRLNLRFGESERAALARDGHEVNSTVLNCSGSSLSLSRPFVQPPLVPSPDGRHVAFSADWDDPEGEIYVVGVDGSGLRRLTHNPGRDRVSDWR